MPLLDADGRPIARRALTGDFAATTGAAGVRSWTFPDPWPGITPAGIAAILAEAVRAGDPETYLALAERIEETDAHYASVLGTRRRQVSQLPVTIIPADGGDPRHAELIEGWLERAPITQGLFDLMDAVGKGYAICEIDWSTDGGQWLPRRLVWRDPRWFRLDRADGRTPRLKTETNPDGIELPAGKFVVHSGAAAKSGLPVRGGVARCAIWYVLFKNLDLKGWVSFAERFGQPLAVGKYHSGAGMEEKRTLLRAVTEIAADGGAIIPDSMLVDFVEAKATANGELHDKLCARLDGWLSKLVLGQTMTTDDGSSRAQAQVHDEVREDIERADADALSDTLNAQVVRPIIDLNFGPQAAYPWLAVGRAEDVDVPALIEAIEKLVPLGLKVPTRWAHETLGIPEPEGDEETLAAPAPAAAPGNPPGMPDGSPPKSAEEAAEMILQLVMAGFAQPRHPAGSPQGGQFAEIPGGGFARLDGGKPAETKRSALKATTIDPPPPSTGERLAVGVYRGDRYKSINGPLRAGRSLDRDTEGYVRDLDGVIARSRVTENVVAFRGVDHPEKLFGTDDLGSLVGARFRDNGFTSTSLDEGVAQKFATDTFRDRGKVAVLEVRVKAGSKALFVDRVPPLAGKPYKEAELLMPRGQAFEIVGHRPGRPQTLILEARDE